MKVKKHILELVSPQLPKVKRLDAVDSAAGLEPADRVTALYVLSFDPDREVAASAAKAFVELPDYVLHEALSGGVAPEVAAMIARVHGEKHAPGASRKEAGEGGNGARPDSADAGGEAGGDAHAGTTGPLPTVLTEEKGKNDETNIYRLIQQLSVAEKIKLALTGNKQARELLLKDRNKIIVASVLKNPRITDEEVIKIANSRDVSQEILRQVASRKEWLKNYNVKVGLVRNPKTPLSIALKLLDHLYEKDLRTVAKSKNVSAVLMNAALRKLDAKARR